MKHLTILFIILLAWQAQAQTVNSYVLWAPPNPLTDVKTSKIGNFENAEVETWNTDLPNVIASTLSDYISTNERGGNVEYIYNPWLGTDVYQVVGPDESADMTIEGKFTATKKENRIETDKVYHTNRSGAQPIPYVIVEYTYSNEVEYTVEVTMTKDDGSEALPAITKTISLAGSAVTGYARPPEKDKIATVGALITKAVRDANWQICNVFVPALVSVTYELEKVKNKDLADKELRKTRNDADRAFKDANFYEAADFFRPMWEQEKATAAAANLGMICELLGNYTHAKELYEAAGYQPGLQRIEQGLKNIKLLEAWGKEIDQESGGI